MAFEPFQNKLVRVPTPLLQAAERLARTTDASAKPGEPRTTVTKIMIQALESHLSRQKDPEIKKALEQYLSMEETYGQYY